MRFRYYLIGLSLFILSITTITAQDATSQDWTRPFQDAEITVLDSMTVTGLARNVWRVRLDTGTIYAGDVVRIQHTDGTVSFGYLNQIDPGCSAVKATAPVSSFILDILSRADIAPGDRMTLAAEFYENRNLLIDIEDVISVQSRGQVLFGALLAGAPEVGDAVTVINPAGTTQNATIREYNAAADDEVGLLLDVAGNPENLDDDFIIVDPISPELTVRDKFTIRGRGTMATGTVRNGTIAVGDQVTILNTAGEEQQSLVVGITANRQDVDRAQPGDEVGIILRGIARDDINCGDLIHVPDNQ